MKSVLNWGAFVDVGVAKDGLLHASEADSAGAYVRDLTSMLTVGDRIEVLVASIDKDRNKLTLTRREPQHEKPALSQQGVREHEMKLMVDALTDAMAAMLQKRECFRMLREASKCPRPASAKGADTLISAAGVVCGFALPSPPPVAAPRVVLTRAYPGGRVRILYEMPWKYEGHTQYA